MVYMHEVCMYAQLLFIQYNITDKTMNIKRDEKRIEDTYGSHETVLPYVL